MIKEELLEMEAKQKAVLECVNKLAAIPFHEDNEENKKEWKAQLKDARAIFNQLFESDMDEGGGACILSSPLCRNRIPPQ